MNERMKDEDFEVLGDYVHKIGRPLSHEDRAWQQKVWSEAVRAREAELTLQRELDFEIGKKGRLGPKQHYEWCAISGYRNKGFILADEPECTCSTPPPEAGEKVVTPRKSQYERRQEKLSRK